MGDGSASSGPSPDRTWLRVGRVGRPHGLDGSFHVADVATAVIERLSVGASVRVAGSDHEVQRLAGHAGRPILRLAGGVTRTDAERLRGEPILLARGAVPELGDDEWWADDLEGLVVRDGERRVGTVTALLALPSCEVLEVRRDGAQDAPALLVPLVRDAVRGVDLDAGTVDVDLAFLGESE